jgi:two-component system nitrogen regulation sensor histidine kinase NtrY
MLVQLVREAVTLQQAGQPGTAFTVSLPDEPIMAELDATMIGQALTNLMKNGGEAIESLIGKRRTRRLSFRSCACGCRHCPKRW